MTVPSPPPAPAGQASTPEPPQPAAIDDTDRIGAIRAAARNDGLGACTDESNQDRPRPSRPFPSLSMYTNPTAATPGPDRRFAVHRVKAISAADTDQMMKS